MRGVFSQEPWNEAERLHFMLNRALVLHKLLTDQQSRRRATAQHDGVSTLHLSWTDHEGQVHDQPLTPVFLAGHARVVRAVAYDLITCGADGQRLAEHLFATLSTTNWRPET